MSISDAIQTSVSTLRGRSPLIPRLAVILGTGLGDVAASLSVETRIPYDEIPGFPRSTVVGHKGELLLGHFEGVPTAAMEGRFHLYEGYTAAQVTFPIRVLRALGADTLFVSNACGGINPEFRRGDLMLIEDHIAIFLPRNPLTGPNDESIGPRFPDMSGPYDPGLLDAATAIARQHGLRCHRGVYVAVPGPQLETRAEYRLLRTLGADAVGMSTVPEVIVAVHGGMRVLGVSIVTDECFPDALQPVEFREILAAAAAAGPSLALIFRESARRLLDSRPPEK